MNDFTFTTTYTLQGTAYPCTVHVAVANGRAIPYLADVNKDGGIIAVCKHQDLQKFKAEAEEQLQQRKGAV